MIEMSLVGMMGVAYLAIGSGSSSGNQLLIQNPEKEPMVCKFADIASSSSVQVDIWVTQARSDRGVVLALMFATSEGFPGRLERAVDRAKSKIVDGRAQLVFREVPSGTYAVVVVHDENNNQALDTNLLGIPNEGVGVSNNPQTRLGPPRFEDAKFSVKRHDLKKRIVLNYF